MKKKNKFNIRGNLKKKLVVALCGVAGLLGIWVAKEAKENMDAEIALAAGQPVAQEVAYAEESENPVLENVSNQENVDTAQNSTNDKGILKKVENVVLWTVFGIEFTTIMTWISLRLLGAEKETSKESKNRMKDWNIKDFHDYDDISIKGNAYNTPDSDYRNTKENGFIPRI